jgi:hypothetical protein
VRETVEHVLLLGRLQTNSQSARTSGAVPYQALVDIQLGGGVAVGDGRLIDGPVGGRVRFGLLWRGVGVHQ